MARKGSAIKWQCYADEKSLKDANKLSKQEFTEKIKLLGSCTSMGTFETAFGKQLDSLKRGMGMRVFKEGIEPVWEDPANTGYGAGKWVTVLPDKDSAKAAFRFTLAALMQNRLPGINGAICTCKCGMHVLIVWTAPYAFDTAGDDPFGMRKFVHSMSESLRVALTTVFKHHAGNGRSPCLTAIDDSGHDISPMSIGNNRPVPHATTTHAKSVKWQSRGSPCLRAADDSDYGISPMSVGGVGPMEPQAILLM